MPSDKATGPDGFNALFFKACWQTIKSDVVRAFQQLHNTNRSSLSCINSSHIVLIPKIDNPASLADFRPISLMHGVAKLFMKVLAIRLAKRIGELITEGQSAFIRGRSIQDNFLYVQGIVRHFHRGQSPLSSSSSTSRAPSTPYLGRTSWTCCARGVSAPVGAT
jgi:hypothetical protein